VQHLHFRGISFQGSTWGQPASEGATRSYSCTTHTPLTLHSYCTRITLMLHSHSTHTPLALHSCSTHAPLILHSHSTREGGFVEQQSGQALTSPGWPGLNPFGLTTTQPAVLVQRGQHVSFDRCE
jgi:hypothetical protein